MNREAGEEKALADIQEYGCHVLHIMEDETGPRFSYSIGIERSSGQTELIVTGLKRELAHSIINEYNDRVRAGERFEAAAGPKQTVDILCIAQREDRAIRRLPKEGRTN